MLAFMSEGCAVSVCGTCILKSLGKTLIVVDVFVVVCFFGDLGLDLVGVES